MGLSCKDCSNKKNPDVRLAKISATVNCDGMEKLKTPVGEIADSFDVNDTKNCGRPIYFSLPHFISTIEMLIASDEIQTALFLLDNPPAWYRDNYPKELKEIKSALWRQIMTPIDYANDADEANYDEFSSLTYIETIASYPRGKLTVDLVHAINNDGKSAHLYELSPGFFWLPQGLKQKGCKFTYEFKTMNQASAERNAPKDIATKPEDGAEHVFIAYEIIEHLWHPEDIYHEFERAGGSDRFRHVMLSTPVGCCGNGLPDWRNRQLGHIRTYTCQEFYDFAMKLWGREYSVHHVDGGTFQVIHCQKIGPIQKKSL